MSDSFVLICGRTARQGRGLNEGKFGQTYRAETSLLRVSPADMLRLGLTEGDPVRLTSLFGTVELDVTPAPADELSPGVLFLAFGEMSSQLMGGDTDGSGMPTSKGLDVQLEKL